MPRSQCDFPKGKRHLLLTSALTAHKVALKGALEPDLRLASAGSDMIRWSRVLLSHTLDVARSY